MADQPLVSVVTCFLNAEAFLQDAVESVRQQRYPNWELLLVDDGSTDGSTEIARGFARAEPGRIRYLEHPGHRNRGPSASRNLGIDHAQGDFIGVLDADDVYLPFKLERQVPLLLSQPDAGMLYGNALFWHSPDLDPSRRAPDFVDSLGVVPHRLYDPPSLLTLLLSNEDTCPCPCSLLIRHDLWRAIGGFEERFAMVYGDAVFLAKAYLHAPVFVTGECSSVYRVHPQSLCHRAELAGVYHPFEPNASRRAFLEWLDGYISANGATDRALQRALRRALLPYHHPVRHSLTSMAAGLRRPRARSSRDIPA